MNADIKLHSYIEAHVTPQSVKARAFLNLFGSVAPSITSDHDDIKPTRVRELTKQSKRPVTLEGFGMKLGMLSRLAIECFTFDVMRSCS